MYQNSLKTVGLSQDDNGQDDAGNPSNRTGAKAFGLSPFTTVLDRTMPLEIQVRILEFLDRAEDKRNARLASTSLAAAGLHCLTTKIRLSGGERAVERLTAISEHPRVRHQIQEIIWYHDHIKMPNMKREEFIRRFSRMMLKEHSSENGYSQAEMASMIQATGSALGYFPKLRSIQVPHRQTPVPSSSRLINFGVVPSYGRRLFTIWPRSREVSYWSLQRTGLMLAAVAEAKVEIERFEARGKAAPDLWYDDFVRFFTVQPPKLLILSGQAPLMTRLSLSGFTIS